MITFSQSVMDSLRNLDVVIDMDDPKFKEDFDTMVENNWEQEKRKKGPRNFKTIRWHTAMGLCAEKALETTGFFKSTAKITKGAVGVSYAKRKTDLRCDDMICEAKSMPAGTDSYRFNDSQKESILRCQPFNDVFVIVAREQVGQQYDVKFRCVPRYIVDAKQMHLYIKRPKNKSDFFSNEFDHLSAIKNDHCIAL